MQQQQTQIVSQHANAWHFRPGEIPIDINSYWRNIFIMRKSTYPGALFLALMQKVLQVFPEFHKGGKSLNLSEEFSQMINVYWLPQASDMMMEILCMGLVVVRYTQVKKGSQTRIPIIMKMSLGTNYTITVFQDPLTGMIEYTYYRLKRRDGTLFDRPLKDPNVRIFSGFGFDPMPQGDIVSPASLLFDEEKYKRLNMRFSTNALFNLSRPTLVTETTTDSEGMLSRNSLIGFYGSSARLRNEERQSYQLNATELREVFEQNRTYFENYGAGGDITLPFLKRQADANVMPLPIGHHLVQQPAPVHRPDMAAMERTYQDYTSAILGIPRPVVMGESGSTRSTSADIMVEMTSETTNVWRSRLSRVYSGLYEDMYAASDKKDALADMTYEEFLDLTPQKFENKVKNTTVKVIFRFISKDSLDSLLTKYTVGIISWKELVQSSRALSSQDSSDEIEYPIDFDPWSQIEKLTAVRSRTLGITKNLGKMGSVVFPELPELTKKNEESSSSSSSLSSSSSSSLSSSSPSSPSSSSSSSYFSKSSEKRQRDEKSEDVSKIKKKARVEKSKEKK